MHKEVAQFNKTHPTIHVTFTDKYADTSSVTAAIKAGTAPNVVMPHLDAAQQLVAYGDLVDLTPYINGKNGYTVKQRTNDFYPSVWNGRAIAPGRQYIIPYEENGQMVIYYNSNLLNKAGIQHPPKTWGQVVADAGKVRALGSKYHGIAWTPSMTQYFVMIKDFGGKIWANSTHTRFALANQGAIDALQMLRNMVTDKSMVLTEAYNYEMDYATGNIGILIDKSAGWTYDDQSAGGKFVMKATEAPSGLSGKAFNYVTGDSLAVLKTGTSAQQQAAWTFVKWLASPSVNAEWNEKTNYLPIGSATAGLMKNFYQTHSDHAAAFSNPIHWMTDPAVNATQYYAAMNAMTSDFNKALQGQESVVRAVQNMNKIGNEYLRGQVKNSER